MNRRELLLRLVGATAAAVVAVPEPSPEDKAEPTRYDQLPGWEQVELRRAAREDMVRGALSVNDVRALRGLPPLAASPPVVLQGAVCRPLASSLPR